MRSYNLLVIPRYSCIYKLVTTQQFSEIAADSLCSLMWRHLVLSSYPFPLHSVWFQVVIIPWSSSSVWLYWVFQLRFYVLVVQKTTVFKFVMRLLNNVLHYWRRGKLFSYSSETVSPLTTVRCGVRRERGYRVSFYWAHQHRLCAYTVNGTKEVPMEPSSIFKRCTVLSWRLYEY